jgi:glycosyltransferase involved in cell wall biosynthesis
MLFTIAIPTYNNEATIVKALNSCIVQHFDKDYEILIVNNNCSDGTDSLLKGIKDSKVRILKNDCTVSMYENHNIALKAAKGRYVLFCHADDILLSNALSVLDDFLIKKLYPSKIVVWGRSLFRDYHYHWKRVDVGLNNISSGFSSAYAFFQGGLTPSGTCYSREEFNKVGGFILSNHRLAPSDMFSMLKLAISGWEFSMLDRILFQRTFASTANILKPSEVIDSMVDSFSILLSGIDNDKRDRLKKVVLSTDEHSFLFINVMYKVKFLTRKESIKLHLKMGKKYSLYIKRSFYKYLLLLIK